MDQSVSKRPRLNQRNCPHCHELLSYKTYRAHKRLYFDFDSGEWYTSGTILEQEGARDTRDSSASLSEPDDSSFTAENVGDIQETPPHSEPALSGSSEDEHPESEPESDTSDEVWSDFEEDDAPDSPPSSPITDPVDTTTSTLVSWLLAFFLLLQAWFHLTDKVLNNIFLFLNKFFRILGHLSSPCARIGAKLPATFYLAQKTYTSLRNGQAFQKYPVCKQCGTVYKFDDCIESTGSLKRAKLCSHVPKLSRGARRKLCNGVLLKTVELASNRKIFYPLMTYCYIDLQTSMEHLLLDKAFVSNCGHCKSHTSCTGVLKDVYDGRIWQQFKTYDSKPFLEDEHSYAFMINMDWFQPYKHLKYSVGAIYLSCFNLPRTQRYKLHNICLIGIIPGPREPELTVNSYLKPLMQDLLSFLEGRLLSVNVGSHIEKKLVRCAILCCSCDLPAGRKLCGLLSHSAHLGCSKCLKFFPSTGDKTLDYSGFERHLWVPRTNHSHREDVETLRQCETKTALERKESELGCRYSVLLDLPYFDPPRMLVIDAMHNLFLGVAKTFFKKILIDKCVLSESDLDLIQKRIDAMAVPSDIGRIPQKIASSFYHFTADQYKNWTIHYSVICLHGLLSSEHMECWRHFVLACRLLCKSEISIDEVTIADSLLVHFCRRIERLFGNEVITPNMHMCCHLRECILDYGPVNHFWLFAFERFNGILGQLPTNNRSIETQMMKRFLNDTQVMRVPLPAEFSDELETLTRFQSQSVGTIGNENVQESSISEEVLLPHSFRRCVFDASEVEKLSELFHTLYQPPNCFVIMSTYKKYKYAILSGKIYGSFNSRSRNASTVLAKLNSEVRPARINYFAKITVMLNDSPVVHVLVSVSWFMHHVNKDVCGKPVTVWEHDLFDLYSFICIEDINCRTVSLVDKLDDTYGNVLFVSPYE